MTKPLVCEDCEAAPQQLRVSRYDNNPDAGTGRPLPVEKRVYTSHRFVCFSCADSYKSAPYLFTVGS